ncbi:recombinase family protein [Caulobacter sp. FWC26]|uniref:recombinase family protein n=1 Tax=Caulobacter sp. FWC26 TaxID=69665 RepID=UPI000C15F34D|nr:recombinase family protein [Caulobacter sp. FWC26]AZS20008.1 recombinase family protein [Caulobacter sp. FWC26]
MPDGFKPALIPAAQYLRMSKDHQRYSIRNQARVIAAYAAERGYTIVKTYTDPGESGLTLRERIGLQALLADVIKVERPYERLLVFDVSRWGRFQYLDEGGHYEFICHSAGVPVSYCAEMFENDGSPIMALLKQFKRYQAAEFSRDLSSKVLYAQLLQAKIGHKLGGPRRYGFERILVDEHDQPIQKLKPGQTKAFNNQRVVYAVGPDHEVKIIRDMFAWYTRDRMSFRGIARRLNEMGVPAGDHPTWGEARVRHLLTDELVLGIYVFNRTTQKLKSKRRKNAPEDLVKTKILEPIISRTLFESAARRRRIRRHRVPAEENLAAVARLFKAKGYLTGKLIDECPYAPGQHVLLQQFGSIHRVYELVGFQPSGWWRPPGQDRPVTKEEMLAALRRLFERDGYVTEATINAEPSVPSAPGYQSKFGKLTNAYRLAGLPYKQGDLQRLGLERLRARRAGEPPRRISLPRWSEISERYSDEELLDRLRQLHHKHGYVTAKLMRADPDTPTPVVYIHRFGTLIDAYGRAGLENRRFNIWSRAARARSEAAAQRKADTTVVSAIPPRMA